MSAKLVVCAVSQCWQIVKFNEYTAIECPIRDIFLKKHFCTVQDIRLCLMLFGTQTDF